MARPHPRTPDQRIAIVTQLLAHGRDYGVVSAFSRTHTVSRPTLSAPRDRVQQAICLQAAGAPQA